MSSLLDDDVQDKAQLGQHSCIGFGIAWGIAVEECIAVVGTAVVEGIVVVGTAVGECIVVVGKM